MLKFNINDQEVEALPEWTVLEAAREKGIHIPTLCYHEVGWTERRLPLVCGGSGGRKLVQGGHLLHVSGKRRDYGFNRQRPG